MKVKCVLTLLAVASFLAVTGCREFDSTSTTPTNPATSTNTATPTNSQPAGAGTVTVAWTAPMQNEDGTPLIDLAGFRIRYGSKYGEYPGDITVQNPGATSQLIAGLAPGLHYFVVSAFDHEGQEGPRSKPERIYVN